MILSVIQAAKITTVTPGCKMQHKENYERFPKNAYKSLRVKIFCFMQWSGVEEGRKRKGMKHIETFKPQPFQMSV